MDLKLLGSRLLTPLIITDTSHVVILKALLFLVYPAQKKFIMRHWLAHIMAIPKHIIFWSALVNNQLEPVKLPHSLKEPILLQDIIMLLWRWAVCWLWISIEIILERVTALSTLLWMFMLVCSKQRVCIKLN